MSRILIVMLTLVLLLRPAVADSVIDLEVQTGKAQQTLRLYVQGDMVRVEDGTSSATICDARGGRVYRLDLVRKTYRVESLGQLDASLSDRLRSADAVHVKARVTAGSDDRVVAGVSCSSLVVKADYGVESLTGAPAVGMPAGGSTPRGGLGIPMGGGSADDGVESPRPRDLRVEGEYWLAGGIAAPAAVRREIYLRTLARGLPRPLVSALLEQVAEHDGFPMASRITVTEIDPGSADAPEQQHVKQTVTMSVNRIASRSVDRMLFIVPADFRQ